MIKLSAPVWVMRSVAAVLALVVVPVILSLSAFTEETPIREDEPSPRTVVAPDLIRVTDPAATDRERREAAAAVSDVIVPDNEAKVAIVQAVEDAFARAQAVRAPGPSGNAPSAQEQVQALVEQLPGIGVGGARLLVQLSDDELAEVASEAGQAAEQLARRNIREDEVDQVAEEELPNELLFARFPDGVEEEVVTPLLRSVLRPTVREDEEATEQARSAAASSVGEIERTYTAGSIIVSAGEVPNSVQMEALSARDLEGSEPWPAVARAFALVLVVALAVVLYLRAYRPTVFNSSKKLLLLSSLFLLFAAALAAVSIFAPDFGPAWLYLVPAGMVAMLATILFDPPVGVLVTIPVTALVAFSVPGRPGITAFAALASLASIPLVSRLSSRGDLRRAAFQSTIGYALLATVFTGVFDSVDRVPTALLAGALNGMLTAVIVNGSLPFLESFFGILTATSLQDLADRNHPLLRELEAKALGSYNHSIMVSTLCERAARHIDADSLLASTVALYHDIGKVRRPYFFVENQFAIRNPHDDLPPETSAEIIQNHVSDGLEMARTFHLPSEIVDGIATHHGTTLVSFFYRQAVNDAEEGQQVDEARFRYKGRKPHTKEMAILMLADSCEGASRAAAMQDRNLNRHDLETIVHRLIEDRVDDGQLDESSLTFRELAEVRDSFVESLVGVYHPRIAYPKKKATQPDGRPDAYVTAPDATEQNEQVRNGVVPTQPSQPSPQQGARADS